MLAELKTLANKKDVPYQSLAKIYLARQISLEQGSYFYSQKKEKVTTGEKEKPETPPEADLQRPELRNYQLVTAYRPDPEKWTNDFRRRKL